MGGGAGGKGREREEPRLQRSSRWYRSEWALLWRHGRGGTRSGHVWDTELGQYRWQNLGRGCNPEFNPYSLTSPNKQAGQHKLVEEGSTEAKALEFRDSKCTQIRTERGTKDVPDAYQPHMVTWCRPYHLRNIRSESFRRQGCSSKIFSLRTRPLLYRQSFSSALQMK